MANPVGEYAMVPRGQAAGTRRRQVRRLRPMLLLLLLLALPAALAGASPTADVPAAPSSTVPVADDAALAAALATAAPGSVIALAPGRYGPLLLRDEPEAPATRGPLTLRSADPARPAAFPRILVRGVSGLTIENVVVSPEQDRSLGRPERDRARAVSLLGVRDIVVRGVDFAGARLDMPDDPHHGYGTGIGLWVGDGSRDVRVEENLFRDWHRAGVFHSSSGIVLRGNDVTAIRSDGFDFAQVTDVLVEANRIGDFASVPQEQTSDHRDMIQFWTNGTERPSARITIRGNLLMSGTGVESQSIFIRNELVDTGQAGDEMFYRDFTIEDNVIHNAHVHGIRVGEIHGLAIRRNTVLHNADGGSGRPVHVPTIRVTAAATGVEITDNIAHAIGTGTPRADIPEDWRITGNLIVQRKDPSRPGHYGQVFVNALADGLARPEDLAVRPGGAAEAPDAGAPATRFEAAPSALTARVSALPDPAEAGRFVFDAGLTADAEGALGQARGRYLWDFGDGTGGEGIRVAHSYASPGRYDAQLTVIRDDGARATAPARAYVPEPQRLLLDATETGAIDRSPYAGAPLPKAETALRHGRRGLRLSENSRFHIGVRRAAPALGLDDFTLSFAMSAERRRQSAGEIFRIHGAMRLVVEPAGGLVFELTNAAGESATLRMRGGRLLDGGWHRVTITRMGESGVIRGYVGGREGGRARLGGKARPAERWGLAFGGLSAGAGFTGLIDDFEIRGQALSASQIAARD